MSPKGLPQSIFAGGQARWLGISIEQAPEQDRALLASVPYSMKSADAEALAGHAPSDFVTQTQFAALTAQTAAAQAQAAEAAAAAVLPYTAPTGSGAANTVPLWTAASTLGNSKITQGTAGIGINEATPATMLDVGGAATVRGTLALPATAAATAAVGANSQPLELTASTFSKTPAKAVPQNFVLRATSSGNNTTTPSASLSLLFGSGATAPAATGLSIAPSGKITFASGQTFPGAGAITGITTTSPLTGSGTSGPVALGLNTSALVTAIATPLYTAIKPKLITGITTASPLSGSGASGSIPLSLNMTALETTLDARYPLLGVGDIFSSYLEAYQTSGPGNAALLGWGSKGSVGAFGDSDTGFGLQGESTSGHGVYAEVTAPVASSSAVLGATGTTFSATYAAEASIANAGVWADSSSAGTGVPVALFATGDDAFAGAFVNNGKDFPAILVDNNAGTAGQFESATGYGVSAGTSSGTGVYGATSGGGQGVEGVNTSATENEAGVLGIANTASSTYGDFNMYAGVWGDTGTSSTTVSPAWAVGVLGTADDGHAGVFLNNSAAWSTLYVSNSHSGGVTGLFKTLMASTADGGTCGIGSGGSLSCTGQIKGLVSAGPAGRTVETYAVQSPESWMEDFGSATLRNGVAIVSIDPAFAETVSADAGYHVFLTPNGDSKGLYVTAKTATSFQVRESGGGTASLSFDYRIVAKRRGYEAQRLVDVSETFNAEQRAALLTRSSGHVNKPKPMPQSALHRALSNPGRRIPHPAIPRAAQPTTKKTAATRP